MCRASFNPYQRWGPGHAERLAAWSLPPKGTPAIASHESTLTILVP